LPCPAAIATRRREPNLVRILLADDHDIVRHGLRDMIARHPGWEVCGEACNGRDAIDMATALRPDVAVIDMVMPDLDGITVTKAIRTASPTTEVLVFTMHESEDLAAAVIAAGGRGCLLKSGAVRSVVTAIETVAAHRPYFPTGATDAVRDHLRRTSAGAEALRLLSPREREVVRLLAEGLDRRAVAAHLGIGERTVKAHQEAAMLKIGAHSVADLVRYALRNGIVGS
jgi:DNA-binding NarL/FixJ family response regulator